MPPAAYELALVCVKSFDSGAVAAELSRAPALRERLGGLALLQNGYGNGEVFAGVFPADRILLARVITGFRRPAPHHVDITVHAAPVRVGPMCGRWLTPGVPAGGDAAPSSGAAA